MLKRTVTLLVALAMAIISLGCNSQPPATGGDSAQVTVNPSANPAASTEAPPVADSESKRVVIYTCLSTTRSDPIMAMVQQKFPEYEIIFEYMGLSELAAKLENEGTHTDIDIALDLGYTYMDKMAAQGLFVDHSEFDDIMKTMFAEEFWVADGVYMPWNPYSGCVAVNLDLLNEKGKAVPGSWQDLLDPQYKDMIEMPNPASSGTGYIFYLMLAHQLGDEAAVEYFASLAENILEFTSSGSAPLKALISKEVGIALCMTYQAALEIDAGVNLQILSFEGGYPWTSDGAAIIAGHDTAAVKEVFRYLYSEEVLYEDAKLMPEHGLANYTTTIENWPKDMVYAQMGEDTLAEKERLLAIWPF